jgi:hypothetical protein
MKPTLATLLASAVAAVCLAACGGDDSTSADSTTVSTTTSADVSMEDYTKQVEDRCAQYQTERTAAEEPLQDVGDPSSLSEDELKAAAPDLAALDDTTRSMIADAEAFPRPADNAAELETIYGFLDDSAAALDDADAAAAAGDVDAMLAAFDEVDAGLQSADKANSANYGFNTCS